MVFSRAPPSAHPQLLATQFRDRLYRAMADADAATQLAEEPVLVDSYDCLRGVFTEADSEPVPPSVAHTLTKRVYVTNVVNDLAPLLGPAEWLTKAEEPSNPDDADVSVVLYRCTAFCSRPGEPTRVAVLIGRVQEVIHEPPGCWVFLADANCPGFDTPLARLYLRSIRPEYTETLGLAKTIALVGDFFLVAHRDAAGAEPLDVALVYPVGIALAASTGGGVLDFATLVQTVAIDPLHYLAVSLAKSGLGDSGYAEPAAPAPRPVSYEPALSTVREVDEPTTPEQLGQPSSAHAALAAPPSSSGSGSSSSSSLPTCSQLLRHVVAMRGPGTGQAGVPVNTVDPFRADFRSGFARPSFGVRPAQDRADDGRADDRALGSPTKRSRTDVVLSSDPPSSGSSGSSSGGGSSGSGSSGSSTASSSSGRNDRQNGGAKSRKTGLANVIVSDRGAGTYTSATPSTSASSGGTSLRSGSTTLASTSSGRTTTPQLRPFAGRPAGLVAAAPAHRLPSFSPFQTPSPVPSSPPPSSLTSMAGPAGYAPSYVPAHAMPYTPGPAIPPPPPPGAFMGSPPWGSYPSSQGPPSNQTGYVAPPTPPVATDGAWIDAAYPLGADVPLAVRPPIYTLDQVRESVNRTAAAHRLTTMVLYTLSTVTAFHRGLKGQPRGRVIALDAGGQYHSIAFFVDDDRGDTLPNLAEGAYYLVHGLQYSQKGGKTRESGIALETWRCLASPQTGPNNIGPARWHALDTPAGLLDALTAIRLATHKDAAISHLTHLRRLALAVHL